MGGEREEEASAAALIPGLPEDIALDCLARVPFQFHAGLRPVCRRWRDAVTAEPFRRLRRRIGKAEDLVFRIQALVSTSSSSAAAAAADGSPAAAAGEGKEKKSDARQPVHALTVYNATFDAWHLVAAPPVPMFAQCAAAGDKLVVLGGWDPVSFDPVADVHVADLASGQWRRGRPMAMARSFFACASTAEGAGKIYVAGGHDGQKNALRSAEVYDVAADEWSALPAMAEERDECRGVAAGGRFWAVSGYRTDSQGRFDSAAEWFDPETGSWTKEADVWPEEAAAAAAGGAHGGGATFSVDGRIWSVDGVRGVREYGGSERGWREVAKAPEGARSSACAAAAAVVGEEGDRRVFVMGGGEKGEGSGGWMVEVGSGRWRRVDTPAGLSGFVFSAAAVRI